MCGIGITIRALGHSDGFELLNHNAYHLVIKAKKGMNQILQNSEIHLTAEVSTFHSKLVSVAEYYCRKIYGGSWKKCPHFFENKNYK